MWVNYGEIIVGFGIIYWLTGSIQYSSAKGGMLGMPSEALYFSLVTITTLGYGDIRPSVGLGQWLVIAEVLLGLLHVTIVFGLFITGARYVRESPAKAKSYRL